MDDRPSGLEKRGVFARMELVVHTGVHHTDDERLLKCLLRNTDDFTKRGIAVPGPGKYRTLLKEGFLAMDSGPPASDARDILIDAILDNGSASRVILSNPHFFGSQRFAVQSGRLYPLADLRMQQLSQLFDSDQIEIFMGVRNPATFLPAVLRGSPQEKLSQALADNAPTDLRWSETVERILDACPGLSITVWCNEDSPLIWADILREMAGLEHGAKISGGFDLLATIIERQGMKRFRAYLNKNPNMPEIQKRRVIEVFLDKYAKDEQIEEELDLPGWTQDLVTEMTEVYEDDVDAMAHIPNVTLISP